MPDRFSEQSAADLARSHARSLDPFFTEALPCEACGEPCDTLEPDPEFPERMIGTDCSCRRIPMGISCEDRGLIFERFEGSIQDLMAEVRLHVQSCRACQNVLTASSGTRKQPGREIASPGADRKVA